MFTGIIEAIGKVTEVTESGENKIFRIEAPFHKDTYLDQSIAHDGVCLTVDSRTEKDYTVTAVAETLAKSKLNTWSVGSLVNLERSLLANTRMDGHFVQGHVDTTSICRGIREAGGSWFYSFDLPEAYKNHVVDKGSIAVDGISLTAIIPARQTDRFEVAVIPFTYEHTNLHKLQAGDRVNLEFDIFGKYVLQYLSSIDLQSKR